MKKIINYLVKDKPNQDHHKKLLDELKKLPSGSYVIQIQSNEMKRNYRGYYFKLISMVASEIGYTGDEMHSIMKVRFNNGHSTSLFKNDQEWKEYINQVKHFIRHELNLSIPDDRDMTYQKWMEMEKQTNKNLTNS